MKTWQTILLMLVTLLMGVPHHSFAASSSNDEWYVELKYKNNLNASWSTPSYENSGAILCFWDGGQGVTVCGSEPCPLSEGTWPCWDNNRGGKLPKLGFILTMQVGPLDDGRLDVTGQIVRMIQRGGEKSTRYDLEKDELSRVERVGGRWTLHIGETEDGESYDLDVTISGYGSTSSSNTYSTSRVSAPVDYVHVQVRHEVEDLGAGRSHRRMVQAGGLEIGPSNERVTRIDLESTLTPYRGDSTVLYTQIKFKNTRVTQRSSGGLMLEATFVMERSLAVGVLPSRDPGMTSISGNMYLSTFERDITLKEGRTLRIRIPSQENERKYIDTDETIELVMSEVNGR